MVCLAPTPPYVATNLLGLICFIVYLQPSYVLCLSHQLTYTLTLHIQQKLLLHLLYIALLIKLDFPLLISIGSHIIPIFASSKWIVILSFAERPPFALYLFLCAS
jgi:hypothetical protein